jgi:hypothetical protein
VRGFVLRNSSASRGFRSLRISRSAGLLKSVLDVSMSISLLNLASGGINKERALHILVEAGEQR